jgi:hypothetical protein
LKSSQDAVRRFVVLLLAVTLWPMFIRAQADGSKPANCEGNLGDEKPETAEAVKHFWQDFQLALQNNDKQSVAAMAEYPMSAYFRQHSVKIRTKREFANRYNEIFPENLKRMLLKEPADCIARVGWRGFSVAEGQVWFDRFSDGNVRITAVNVVVYPDDPK